MDKNSVSYYFLGGFLKKDFVKVFGFKKNRPKY